MSKENSNNEDAAAAAAASDASANARSKDPNADMYENRPKKIIRVVTVIAYLFSVSFAAILLSTYYIFLWEPPNPRLIERERLRADPEMQFLFADAPSSSEKKDDLALDRDYKPFQSRVIDYDDDPDEKRTKLNTMLIKLRYSLVEIMRANNGSRSLEPISDDLFVMVKEMLNSTKRMSHRKNSMPKFDKNIAEEKTQSVSDVDSPLRFENSMSINGEKYSRNRTSRFLSTNVDNFRQNHSFGMNYSNNNNNNRINISNNQIERIIARSGVSIESSLPRSSKFADDPEFHHYSSNISPAVKPWLYTMNSEASIVYFQRRENTHLVYDFYQSSISLVYLRDNGQGFVGRDFLMMQLLQNMSAHNMMASIGRTLGKSDNKLSTTNEIRFAGDGRKDKLYEPKHKQKLVRVLTVIAYVIFVSLAAILLSLYYTFVWNPKNQAVRKRIDKPECPKPSLDILTIPPIFNETQIERMIARSTTMDNKQAEKADSLTTQRQKDISTETTDIEETSMELTSVLTAQDYHNNFTSVANDAVDNVT